MARRLEIGAVSYLNTLPLVHGMAHGLAADRIRLSYATPSVLSERMAAGELDVALLPVIELARIPDLEVVPGLGITTRGRSRSVLLVSNRPVEQISSLALDPDSRTSNALCRLLLAEVWNNRPETIAGGRDLDECLRSVDAAVRIGDKALFEPAPPHTHVYDLGEIWSRETRLPFVFAAWTARAGVVDRELYGVLHASRREGSKAIARISEQYRWRGTPQPEVAHEYLTEHIRFRLGGAELRAMEVFFRAAHEQGLIDVVPPIRLALQRWTACHEIAAELGPVGRPTR